MCFTMVVRLVYDCTIVVLLMYDCCTITVLRLCYTWHGAQAPTKKGRDSDRDSDRGDDRDDGNGSDDSD